MADELNGIELATELTVAWLGNQNTRVHVEDVPTFLQSMHDALNGLSRSKVSEPGPVPQAEPKHEPAVSARKSLASSDHILSMIDGKPYKTLRRHLSSNGLTPDEYRKRYGLKADYPMVAPSYSESRRSMAHKIGLGRKAVEAVQVVETVAEEVAAPMKKEVRRARTSVTEAKQAAQDHLGGESAKADAE